MSLSDDSSEQEDLKKNPKPEKCVKIIKLSIDQINSDRRILIVDDEPYNIMGLKIVLLQAGYGNIKNIIE
jgi:hypothetical protein